MRVAGYLALIIVLLSISAVLKGPEPVKPLPVTAAPAPIILPASDRVDVSKFTWKRAGFKTVAEASFVLTNRNEREVRDVVVSCDFVGNSGTKISSARRTIYEVVPSGKSVQVRDVNFGFIDQQATGARCIATDAKW